MKTLVTLFAVGTMALVGCGKSEENKVEAKGKDKKVPVGTKVSLDGTYETACKDGARKVVTIKGADYTYESLKFEKKDCTGKKEVLNQTVATVTIKTTDVENFTHVVEFVEKKGGAEYSSLLSVSPTAIKFEKEDDTYLKK